MDPLTPNSPCFATTHWSMILTAGQVNSPDAEEALEVLCRTYWYPLYAFARRHGKSPEDAQDLTQEFFARMLEKTFLGRADPARGRFRSFLLSSFQNFLAESHRHSGRLRRGGGNMPASWDSMTAEERYRAEPRDGASADHLYERRWALTLLESTLNRLERELTAAGKEKAFAELKGQLFGDSDAMTYAQVSRRLEMSQGAVKVAVHRLRQRFRALLRQEVAHTVAHEEEIDEELRYLIRIVRNNPL